jgi:hypothetical protein
MDTGYALGKLREEKEKGSSRGLPLQASRLASPTGRLRRYQKINLRDRATRHRVLPCLRKKVDLYKEEFYIRFINVVAAAVCSRSFESSPATAGCRFIFFCHGYHSPREYKLR